MKTVNVWDSAADLSLPSDDYAFHRSGLIVPERLAKRPVAIDFFAGAGGFSLGFMQAGFEVVAALDFDHYCMMTYLTNLGAYPCQIHWIDPADKERVNAKMERDMKREAKKNGGIMQQLTAGSGWISNQANVPGVSHYFYGDIRKITGAEILEAVGMKRGQVDCVMGGPPCQGFSVAGRRDVMDPRNSLVFEFAQMIIDIQPKTFVMENVPGMLSMHTPEGLPVVDAFCRVLEDGGFGTFDALKKGLLTSAGCGAALKGGRRPKRAKEEDGPEDDTEQLSLFEEATP